MSAVPATWSPASNRRISRRILQVPKAQQTLLERDNSWHPAPSGNVPEHILRSAKEVYVESTSPRPKQKPPPPDVPLPSTTPQTQPGDPPATSGQNRKRPAPPDFDDEDREERQVSWSPSPPRNLRPESLEVEDAEPMEGLEPSPAQSLPSSRSPSRPLQRRLPQPVPPPSSSQVSVELEIEVPLAITNAPEAAVPKPAPRPLGPTPPSAQIIPCTLKSMTSPAEPEAKRFRRMIDISSRFSPPLAELVTPALRTSTAGGMAATATSHTIPPLASPNFAAPSISPFPSRPVIKDPNRSLENSSSDKPPPNGPPSQVPFVAFRTAYPDFSATLNDFLRAVLSVQSLQKRSRLPEFLYDDYIRVFCGDYMDYVKAHDPTAQPLPIFEFYNENVSIPQYTKRIILRANLPDILECYPTEVAALTDGFRRPIIKAPTPSNDRHSFSYRDSSASGKRFIEVANPPIHPVELVKPPSHSVEVIKAPIHTAELASDPIEIAEATQPPRKPFSRSTSATTINSLSNRSFSAAAAPAPEKAQTRRVSPVREAPTPILPSIEAPSQPKETPRPLMHVKPPSVAISPMETQPRMPSPILGHDRRKTFPMPSATTSIQDRPLPSHTMPSTAVTNAAERIPETVARPKSSARPSRAVPASTASSSKSRKSIAAMDPAERDRRWKKHLERTRQSSAPGGSAAAPP